jgi:hypothetical protein
MPELKKWPDSRFSGAGAENRYIPKYGNNFPQKFGLLCAAKLSVSVLPF